MRFAKEADELLHVDSKSVLKEGFTGREKKAFQWRVRDVRNVAALLVRKNLLKNEDDYFMLSTEGLKIYNDSLGAQASMGKINREEKMLVDTKSPTNFTQISAQDPSIAPSNSTPNLVQDATPNATPNTPNLVPIAAPNVAPTAAPNLVPTAAPNVVPNLVPNLVPNVPPQPPRGATRAVATSGSVFVGDWYVRTVNNYYH